MLDSVCLLGSNLNVHTMPGKPGPSRNTIGFSIRPQKVKILVALLSILNRVYHIYCQSTMNVRHRGTPEFLWTHTYCFHRHNSFYIT